MQMNGMAELITVAQVLAAVDRPAADRRRPAQQRPQPGHLGDAGHGGLPASSRPPNTCPTSTTPHSPAAWACTARTSTTPTNWAGRGTRALAADRPTVLDVRCDPDVPPIPPHATFDQAKSLVKSAISAATTTPRASSSRASSRRCSNTFPARRTESSREDHRARTALHDVRTGRFERTLSALTAAGAAVTAGGDLPVPRRRQLRQQDDVLAGRGGAHRGPGGHRRLLLAAGGPHGASRGQRRDRRQRPAGRLPAHARHRSASRRAHQVQHGVRTAGLRAAAGVAGWRHGPAGGAAAPRGSPSSGRWGPSADAVPPPRPARRHPAAPGALPGLRRARSGRHWDDVTAGVVLARLALPYMLSFFTPPRSASPRRCWTCCWPRR